MENSKKSFIGVRLTTVQREVLERSIDNDFFPDMSMSSYVIFLIQLRAHDVLGFDFEQENFSFDILLELFKQKESEKAELLKKFMGADQYHTVMKQLNKGKKED